MKKRAPKKGQKRGKKTTKRDIFSLFFCASEGKQSPHNTFSARRALALSTTHRCSTSKNAFEASASNSFERKGTRRDFVFFSRGAFWSHHHLLPDLIYARFDFFGRHSSFLSKKEEERRRSKDVLAFPIRAL